MRAYLNLLADVIATGVCKEDRTGTGTVSVFGRQVRFDLNEGFPLLTTKAMSLKSIAAELAWFLRGDTNNNSLNDLGCTIWDPWAAPDGDLGPIYGSQWRTWMGDGEIVDQIGDLVRRLKNNPDSRRHVVSAWNVSDLPNESVSPQENVRNGKMCLAPCHCLFQCYVARGQLSLHLYQRSADLFIGVPYNIASYALLTHLLAQEIGAEVGDLVISFGDLHIYYNHLTQDIVYEQLGRKPRQLPILSLDEKATIDNFDPSHVDLALYNPYAPIKAPISV